MSNSIQFVLKSAFLRSYLGRPESPADVGRKGVLDLGSPGLQGFPPSWDRLGQGAGVAGESKLEGCPPCVLLPCLLSLRWAAEGEKHAQMSALHVGSSMGASWPTSFFLNQQKV